MNVRLWPDSIFGRLLGALLLVIGLAVVTIAVLIVRERQELAFRGSRTQDLVTLIANISQTLAQMMPEARIVELARLHREPLVFGRPSGRVPLMERDPLAMRRWFQEFPSRLGRQLGEGFRVDVRPMSPSATDATVIRVGAEMLPPPYVDPASTLTDSPARPDRPGTISTNPPSPADQAAVEFIERRMSRPRGAPPVDVVVTLPDGLPLTFRTSVPPADPPLPKQIFLQLGVLTAVLAVVLYLMTRTITGPLSELARAAEAVGRGARHLPLRETGARELREATLAFNVMQERLHRYLDSRTRVLSAMSHDLRTPLTRLKLRAELLENVSLRQRFSADLEQMSGMVEGALKLFRGLNEDEPERRIVVRSLVDDVGREFGEVEHAICIRGSTDGEIVGRPQALKRCIGNLISNAIKYGTRADVIVEDRPSEIVVRILDEGPGIPEHALEQVFEPFFRIEDSRNSETGGTGLGLNIARDFAQAHGGSISLQNRPGGGLEAVLRLPKTRAAFSGSQTS